MASRDRLAALRVSKSKTSSDRPHNGHVFICLTAISYPFIRLSSKEEMGAITFIFLRNKSKN